MTRLALRAAPAAAQTQCAPRDDVVSYLASEYGETMQSMGLARDAVVVVFANRTTGTWTITRTDAHGVTCLMASGARWEAARDVRGVPG
jgi:hypothetical protein